MDDVFSLELIEEFQQFENDYQYRDTIDTDIMDSETIDESEIDETSINSVSSQVDVQPSAPTCTEAAGTQELEENSSSSQDKIIHDFMCCCNLGPRKTACSLQFTRELIKSSRLNCQEMTKAELDLVVLANLDANRRYAIDQQKSRVHIQYFYRGQSVCKKMFLYVHSIGTKTFKNLVMHFDENSLTPRMHGNTKRLPSNAMSYSTTENITKFITNFATVHALPLPGRIPGVYSEKLIIQHSFSLKLHQSCIE